jgi:hypothetical protein
MRIGEEAWRAQVPPDVLRVSASYYGGSPPPNPKGGHARGRGRLGRDHRLRASAS